MVHSKALLSRTSGQLGVMITNHIRTTWCWDLTVSSANSQVCRLFGSAPKKGNDKKKAMKRQLQNAPPSSQDATIQDLSPGSSSSTSATLSPNNFATTVNPSDQILSSSRIIPPSSFTPIQAEPISKWETNKYHHHLSSLPDDAAQLQNKEEL